MKSNILFPFALLFLSTCVDQIAGASVSLVARQDSPAVVDGAPVEAGSGNNQGGSNQDSGAQSGGNQGQGQHPHRRPPWGKNNKPWGKPWGKGAMVRRDPSGSEWYEVGDGLGGAKVWSTVDPTEKEKREVGDFKPQTEEDVLEWMAANNIEPEGGSEEHTIEKRVASWVNCGICMAICGANAEGIHLLSLTQKVQFCLGNCVAQGACNVYYRTKYQDTYHNGFAPAGTFPRG